MRIHENHHLWSKTRVGRARADGQYEVVFETAELMEPDPFPAGYQVMLTGVHCPTGCRAVAALLCCFANTIHRIFPQSMSGQADV